MLKNSFARVILILCLWLIVVDRYCYASEKRLKLSKATLRQVKDFTAYEEYFQLQRDARVDTSNSINVNICLENDYLNSTMMTFSLAVDRCIRYAYHPRLLSPTQISWKSSHKAKTPTTNTSSVNSEDNSKNGTETNNSTISENNAKTTEVIHPYLAFALLLPDHPFSFDLYKAIVAVAPMFPSVTVVIGNGYHFRELCAQYNVRSFPKLLFFKGGLFIGRFKLDQQAPQLAVQFSKWTGSLPRSPPRVARRGFDQRQFYHHIMKSSFKPSNSTNTKLQNDEFSFMFFNSSLSAVLNQITMWSKTKQSVEPIMGTFESAVAYDMVIFMLSGIYIIISIIYRKFASR